MKITEPHHGDPREACRRLRIQRVGPCEDGLYHLHGMGTDDAGKHSAWARFFVDGPKVIEGRKSTPARCSSR